MRLLPTVLAMLAWLSPALAMEVPRGPVLLTVTGAIDTTNAGDAARFDRAMLESLDWQEVRSHTEFTEGPQHFAGPTLASLLDRLGVEDGVLRATGLDDYRIDIPVADADEFDPILALDRNGRPMRIRDKGPIWIIYPAETPEDVSALHSLRSIWQLYEIDVLR